MVYSDTAWLTGRNYKSRPPSLRSCGIAFPTGSTISFFFLSWLPSCIPAVLLAFSFFFPLSFFLALRSFWLSLSSLLPCLFLSSLPFFTSFLLSCPLFSLLPSFFSLSFVLFFSPALAQAKLGCSRHCHKSVCMTVCMYVCPAVHGVLFLRNYSTRGRWHRQLVMWPRLANHSAPFALWRINRAAVRWNRVYAK